MPAVIVLALHSFHFVRLKRALWSLSPVGRRKILVEGPMASNSPKTQFCRFPSGKGVPICGPLRSCISRRMRKLLHQPACSFLCASATLPDLLPPCWSPRSRRSVTTTSRNASWKVTLRSCISRSSPFPYLPPWKQSCQSIARLAERESKSELPESLGYVVEALCRQMWRKNHPDPHGVSLYEETRSLLPRWNEVNLSLLPLGSACC